MTSIIIVDDEKLLRKGFIHMTDWLSHGYKIVGEAGNGEEALQLVKALGPDVVVTDIRMPGMDGVQLIREIKSAYPQIEVIVLSSYSDFPYVKESLQLGAADYILKASMSFDEVLQALDKATGKRNAPDSGHAPQLHNKGAEASGTAADSSAAFYEKVPGADRLNRASSVQARPPLPSASWNWKDIRPYVDIGDLDALYESVYGAAVRQISQGNAPEPYHLQKNLVELVYMIIHKLDEAGWNPDELQRSKLAHFRKMETAGHFDECMEAFRKALNEIAEFLTASGYLASAYSPTVKAVVSHLHQNYADPELSLGETAKKFHLNKSYLSQLFKQQTGVNFQNYVTRIRIDKAKELLKQNEPVSEVCAAVGIDNISYFSQLFKRWAGVSPSDYARERGTD
ncbi:response regulator transcription factor [Paenibacillus hamazuiensis]|uniref:response regulator transcription factor n=1 Tax=Paenibacillus hamazuiensis TaxID=2936508 RepID=UPI0020103884|nr:response regulator [Paenibacillus hamazuiensis]